MLKQEAIKWVKHFQNIEWDGAPWTPDRIGCIDCGDAGKEEILMHFFNLTEEDLK